MYYQNVCWRCIESVGDERESIWGHGGDWCRLGEGRSCAKMVVMTRDILGEVLERHRGRERGEGVIHVWLQGNCQYLYWLGVILVNSQQI